ncbi:hypothetical protein [Gimesia algae]|uniref:Uncharacterized protein n=1 Tax=Gimesia algae TaxID=2527971 RepID=A0A517VAX0_9PLAN|nr:hypothetical protein [Gimesia algae]QDT90155.1 hypothetical protein Pan161_18050 [Gimesia algae]
MTTVSEDQYICDECCGKMDAEMIKKEEFTDELIQCIEEKIKDSGAFQGFGVPYAELTTVNILHLECFAGGGIDIQLEVNAEFDSLSALCKSCDIPGSRSTPKSAGRRAREAEEIEDLVGALLRCD